MTFCTVALFTRRAMGAVRPHQGGCEAKTHPDESAEDVEVSVHRQYS